MGDEEQSDCDWEQEEQLLSDEESGYEEDQWTDDCSNTDYDDDPDGGELEPEPPDHYQDNTSSVDWSREEADQRNNHEGELYPEEIGSEISLEEHSQHEEEIHGVETEDCFNEEAEAEEVYQEDGFDYNSEHEEPYVEERPWCEIPYSDHEEEDEEESRSKEIPWCELPYSDQEDDHQGETDAQVSSDYSEVSYGDEPESHPDSAEENEVLSEAGRDDDDEYKPRYITYSGYNQGGPEDYFRWEKDMEDWFQAHNIPEKKKTMYAEATLIKNAYVHWEQDSCVRFELELPEYSWEEMKEFLHKDFVEDAEFIQEAEEENYAEPERLIMAVRSTPKAKPKKTCDPKPRNILCDPSTSKSKAKEAVKLKPKEPKAVKKKINQQEKGSYQSSLQAPKVQDTYPGAKKVLQVPKKKAEQKQIIGKQPNEVVAKTPICEAPHGRPGTANQEY
ncbi:uncharacterized protein LOC130501621 [Raphanus sativus]|uniref:Uncharacterized protein LOC130501621 n=1 Tax=Raphanus sativus TaxID=3726 RepID=A0A9W3CLM9_RAPSA|nr:uncharacterized protein LOC130501621 [Raphanus sativus]